MSSSEIVVLALGVVAHAVCIGGVVLSFAKGSRTTSMRFALAGMLSVLAILITAWVGYRMNLTVGQQGMQLAGEVTKFEVQVTGIHLALAGTRLAMLLAAAPFLLSLLLLTRGFMLPVAGGQPTARRASVVVATCCMGVGLGLLCSALVTWLNFAGVLQAILLWMV